MKNRPMFGMAAACDVSLVFFHPIIKQLKEKMYIVRFLTDPYLVLPWPLGLTRVILHFFELAFPPSAISKLLDNVKTSLV